MPLRNGLGFNQSREVSLRDGKCFGHESTSRGKITSPPVEHVNSRAVTNVLAPRQVGGNKSERNSTSSGFQVTALLALSEGAQFLSNGLLYVTERLRLGPHGATSLVVRLLVTTPGVKNMTGE